MSVILPTDTWITILPVVTTLSRLGCSGDLEIVIVMPPRSAAFVDESILSGFGSHVIVEFDPVIPLGGARAAGVRAARSDFVFIGETHSFPREGMFESLLAAHAAGNTVAVPAFENWNPDGSVSWAGFITGYASWTEGRAASLLASAPTFNVSYSRSFLAGLGAGLERAMTEGEDLLALVHAAGHRVWFEPRARIGHANISRAGSFLHQRYLAGRVIAGNRSRTWSPARRSLFVLSSPLIPLVLLSRHREGIARALPRDGRYATLAAVVLGLAAQAAGELAGYAAGSDPATRDRYDDYEIRRLAFARGLRHAR